MNANLPEIEFELDRLHKLCVEKDATIARLEAELATARQHFRDFARHRDGCYSRGYENCDCGLAAAIDAAKGGQP